MFQDKEHPPGGMAQVLLPAYGEWPRGVTNISFYPMLALWGWPTGRGCGKEASQMEDRR